MTNRKRNASHSLKATLRDYYDRMASHFGHTDWWPGDSPFEISIGAILTQNTAWTNVEKAIVNLRAEKLLTPKAMLTCPTDQLETALRPSGYFRMKTRRVRAFCQFLVDHHGGSVKRMAKRPLAELRPDLLGIHGIGPETADDILLYACEKPVFVVDAYTRRIFSRHGLVAPDVGYEDLRATFEDQLDHDVAVFKEYHGLVVYTAKDFCRKRPSCDGCPLAPTLKRGQPHLL
jgi:endonuclease-3 related protein